MPDKLLKSSDKKDGDTCGTCATKTQFFYWCEVCEKTVAEKRCPSCGLKAKKIR
jgi:predicted RNA-binding protein with PUA domain